MKKNFLTKKVSSPPLGRLANLSSTGTLKLHTCVVTKAIAIIFLFIFGSSACGASEPPQDPKLPKDVFFLNDTRWEETDHWSTGSEFEPIYDPETGKEIGKFGRSYDYINISSVIQVGENKAEMYYFINGYCTQFWMEIWRIFSRSRFYLVRTN